MAKFSDIVGQEEIKAELKSAIDNNHISNAYIIQGENRSGKEYVAKVFAQALVCEKLGECTDGSMNEACGECKACHQAASMNHPDIIYVRHEKPNSIGIDDVREGIIDTVFIKPLFSLFAGCTFRVFDKKHCNHPPVIFRRIRLCHY
jgi:DNA polymerase-3 subunit delta'